MTIQALSLALLLVACQPAVSDDATQEPPTQTVNTYRVILGLGGKNTVQGTLLSRSDEQFEIRTTDGQIKVLRPEEVMEIVRLVDPVEGQRGRVYLRSGQSHLGIVKSDDFHRVVIEIQGIEISWMREDVHFVELEPTFQEQYDQYKNALVDGAWARHILFARWLLKENEPTLALEELSVIERGHDTPEVRNLIRIARARLLLSENPTETMDGEQTTTNTSPQTNAELEKIPRLSEQDINRIRIYEIDFSKPPNVRVDPNIIHALIEAYSDHPLMPSDVAEQRQLFEAEPIEVARFMRRLEASDLIDGIQVQEDPRSMLLFKERIHERFLTRSCGTANCHGGPGVGDFRLVIPTNPDDVAARYTNYIILRQGASNGQWPILNLDTPENSLLLQYALPRNQSQKQHPAVRGWKPSLNTSNRQTYAPALNWIDAMGKRPWHNYPITYPPEASESRSPKPNQPQSTDQTTP